MISAVSLSQKRLWGLRVDKTCVEITHTASTIVISVMFLSASPLLVTEIASRSHSDAFGRDLDELSVIDT